MLLPSSIQRADDLVGIAMPTLALPCANAPPLATATQTLASASVRNLFLIMFLSLVVDLCLFSTQQRFVSAPPMNTRA